MYPRTSTFFTLLAATFGIKPSIPFVLLAATFGQRAFTLLNIILSVIIEHLRVTTKTTTCVYSMLLFVCNAIMLMCCFCMDSTVHRHRLEADFVLNV